MPKLTANALGSLYMVIGSLGYVVNDGFVRKLTETDGLGVYQVLCLRSIGLALFFAAVGRARHEQFRRSHLQRPFLWRIVAEVSASALFFAGVVRLEFANAQAILQVVPFAVTLAAALVIGERVEVRQYVAIAIGFVGVLIVIRPATDGFSAWSLVVLASAVLMVLRELATRDVDRSTPALSIAFATAVGLFLLTGVLSAFDAWVMPSPGGWGLLAASVASLAIGYFFTIQTVRVGDLSVSAPFRYTILVGAVVIGFVLFDEVPDTATIVGSLVIVATGVYAVQLERQARIRAAAPAVR